MGSSSRPVTETTGQPSVRRRVLYFLAFGAVALLITVGTVALVYGDILGRLNAGGRRESNAVAPGVTVQPFAQITAERAFPIGLAAATDGSGAFYLGMFGSGTINRVSKDGEVRPYEQLTAVGAVAAGPDGTLYAVDYPLADARVAGGLVKFEAGTSPTQRTKTAINAGPLSLFSQLALDPAGNVYVSHTESGEVWRVTPSGAVSAWWSIPDLNQTKAQPIGLAYDAPHNALIVADAGTGSIYRIDLSSTGGQANPTATPLYRAVGFDPRVVAVDEQGRVLVAHWQGDNGVLARLEADGTLTTLADNFRRPMGLVYQAGKAYVVNSDLLGLLSQVQVRPPFTVDVVSIPQ